LEQAFLLGIRVAIMPRYYFDIRDGDELAPDEEGVELTSMEAVQLEAARSLAAMARDAIPAVMKSGGHRMAVEVRDDVVMKVLFTFEAVSTRH
jgi:hypothetical protein